MEELSIEEKAIRYDNLLVKLQEAKVDNSVCDERYCCVIDDIVPELKESEDEKMRKSIIYALRNGGFYNNDKTDEALAWLEKQCEQNHVDKIEPKFKTGQWIVWQDKCYKVNYNGCGYELVDQNGLSTSLEYGTVNENAHLWDITKDAKEGDILVIESGRPFIFKGCLDKRHPNSPVAYCGIDCGDDFHVSVEISWWADGNVFPATKEQRDFLFQEMKDAGYEWDAEKKELIKL